MKKREKSNKEDDEDERVREENKEGRGGKDVRLVSRVEDTEPPIRFIDEKGNEGESSEEEMKSNIIPMEKEKEPRRE